jgi:hypothetical protein
VEEKQLHVVVNVCPADCTCTCVVVWQIGDPYWEGAVVGAVLK